MKKLLIIIGSLLFSIGALWGFLVYQYRLEINKMAEDKIEKQEYETEIILFDDGDSKEDIVVEEPIKENPTFIEWVVEKAETIFVEQPKEEKQKPVEPKKDDPSKPQDPTEPTDPTDPVDPVDPQDPKETEEPEEPIPPAPEDENGLIPDGEGNYSLPYITIPD